MVVASYILYNRRSYNTRKCIIY